MLNRARSALADKNPALSSKPISIASRFAIHSIYVRCYLLQNVAVLQVIPSSLMQKLDAEYLRGIRLCTNQVVTHAGDLKLSNADMLARFGVPTLTVLMERRVLSFFLKLATVDNSFVRASLAGSFSRLTLWHRTFHALNSLRECKMEVLDRLPIADQATVYDWATFAVNHCELRAALVKSHKRIAPMGDPKVFRGVPQARSTDGGNEQEVDQASQHPSADDQEQTPEGMAPVLSSDIVAGDSRPGTADVAGGDEPAADPLQCSHCNFRGKSNAGLQAHLRRSRQIFDLLSLRVATAECEACDLNFGTRWTVLEFPGPRRLQDLQAL
eukprot:1050698-Amphidinium_carterae.2